MKTARERLKHMLRHMNATAHEERCRRDSTGNLGPYRVATHDGADYLYVSDYYGIAMTSYSPEELSEGQCRELLAMHSTRKKNAGIKLKDAAAVLGRKGGSVKSERKAAASRENGKKGGRPRSDH